MGVRRVAVAWWALVLVLFFGGLAANWQQMRQVLVPSMRLATLGSLLTAAALAVVVVVTQHLPWRHHALGVAGALFVGAMFCSTDASAVLSLLRPLRQRLPQRLLDLLECESGFNDPIAVVLAGLAIALPHSQDTAIAPLLVEVVRQFLLGAFVGFLGGKAAELLLGRRRPAWLADFRDAWILDGYRPPFPTRFHTSVDRRLERAVMKRADVVTVAQRLNRDDLLDRHGIEARYINNGWDPELELPAEPGQPDPDNGPSHEPTLPVPDRADRRRQDAPASPARDAAGYVSGSAPFAAPGPGRQPIR
jgi:hypothetical protein